MNSAGEVLALMARHEPGLIATARIGLSRARVRELAERYRPVEMPGAAETRVLMAKNTRRTRQGRWGRRGLPEYVWRAMYDEYCAGRSCTGVAAIFGGTRQSVHDVFKTHSLKLRPRHPRLMPKRIYMGVAYTQDPQGYFRATTGDRFLLHHRMWEDANGPIPEGWQVMFRNADNSDVRLDNLDCRPIAAVTLYHFTRLKVERSRLISPRCQIGECGHGTAAAFQRDGSWIAVCVQHWREHGEATPIGTLRRAGEKIGTP